MSNPYQPPKQPATPYYSEPYGPYGQPPPTNALATTSLIVGVISLPLSCVCGFFSVPLGLTALILGFVAVGQINQTGAAGKGMAIAGIVCGGISVGLAILGVILTLTMQLPGFWDQF